MMLENEKWRNKKYVSVITIVFGCKEAFLRECILDRTTMNKTYLQPFWHGETARYAELLCIDSLIITPYTSCP
jgi:hypothetical protein